MSGKVTLHSLHRALCLYLFGDLAKVTDVSQHCALDDGVLGVLPVSLSIEVRVEGVQAFHSGRALLPVPKNQVDPQVQTGTHVVTFQGLKETVEQTKTTQQSNIKKLCSLKTHQGAVLIVITDGQTPSVKLLI